MGSDSEIAIRYSTTKGTLFGIVICVTIVYLIEAIGHFFYPLPTPLNSNLSDDIIILKEYVENATIPTMIFPLLSYSIGSFVGGFIANYYTKSLSTSIYVGALLLILILIALKIIPHQNWYIVTSCTIPVPFAILGGIFCKSWCLK